MIGWQGEADDIRAVLMVMVPPGLPLGRVSAETQDVPLRSGTSKGFWIWAASTESDLINLRAAARCTLPSEKK